MNTQEQAALALAQGQLPGATRVITPVGWTDLVVGGGWITVAANPLRYRLAADGQVHLKGAISGGAAAAVIATMPAGFRPLADNFQTGQSTAVAGPTYAPASVQVQAAGDIRVENAIAIVDSVNFEGVSWSVF